MYLQQPANSACLSCHTKSNCLASQLTSKQLQQLEQCGQLGRNVSKGAVIFRQNDSAESIYSVKTGAIKTFQLTVEGRQQVTGFKLPGSAFGLIDMAATSRTEYAEAVTDSVICGFSSSRLKAIMVESPALLDNFIRQCSEQMRVQQDNAKDDEAVERVLRFFAELQKTMSRPGLSVTGFTLPMSNKDIANYLRLRPETLSRLFQQLKASGRLVLQGRNVVSFAAEAVPLESYRLAS